MLNSYSHYFRAPIFQIDTLAFIDIRPLNRSEKCFRKASRECVIETDVRLITMFGGEWNTPLVLAIIIAGTLAQTAKEECR